MARTPPDFRWREEPPAHWRAREGPFRSLQLDEGELSLELLLEKRELVPSGWRHTNDTFTSSLSARQSAGRRKSLVRN